MNKTITIIGPNTSGCTKEVYNLGIDLGKMLVDIGFIIVNGGMQGVMEAVFKGARQSLNYSFPRTIGIIPSLDKKQANKYCDIVIPTGLNYARNQLVVNSSNFIIAIGGGAGTLSEIAYAWQLNKTIYCFDNVDGWAKEMARIQLDNRNNGAKIIAVSSIDNLKDCLVKYISSS